MTQVIEHGVLKHAALKRGVGPTGEYRPDLNKPRKGSSKMTRLALRSIKLLFPTIALVMAYSDVAIRADDAPAVAAPRTGAAADAPQAVSLVERIEAIRTRSQASLTTARGNRAEIQAAIKQRREELAALAAEVEAEPSDLSVADLLALANVYSRDLQRPDDAVQTARTVIAVEPANAEAWTILIGAQAGNPNTLDAAEDSLKKAAEQLSPDKLAALHGILANWQLRSGQPRVAADHFAATLDLGRWGLLGAGGEPTAYFRRVEQTVGAYNRAKADDAALARVDRELAVVASDEARNAGIDVPPAIAELTAQKIRLLLRVGQTDAARTLLAEALQNARTAYDAAPEDASRVQALLPLAQLDWEQSSANAPGEPTPTTEAAATETTALYLELLGKVLKNDKIDAKVRRSCAQSALAAGFQLLSDDRLADADAIAKLLGESIASDAPEPAPVAGAVRVPIDPFQNQVRSFLKRLAGEQARMALVGQPAFPLETNAWVNGDPLTDEDLKGKVVLLDFWAVWCGPCIACFPHLRQWHEKYADRGLVIIGLTKYYSYGWDAAANRGTKTEGLTPEDEQAALVKFAEHHQLKHRLAYMPEGATLSERYGVSGIPQMVLIDREGKVRMIRVGSGEANAHDLETLIEELLAAPAEGAPTGGAPAAAAPATETPASP